MICTKEKIRDAFSRSAATYDKESEVQAYIASELTRKLQEISPKTILEIGCGTGNLSKLLLDRYHPDSLVLNDISEKMIAICTHLSDLIYTKNSQDWRKYASY